MNNSLPNRQSTRLRGFNYGGPGTYFVTVCTDDRWHFFGKVALNAMRLSDWGQIASQEWPLALDRRPYIIPHAFIVMPNHVHALVSFDPATTPDRDMSAMARGMPPQSLGRLLNGYKGAVTTVIRGLIDDRHFVVWQRNYHDCIVRDRREFDSIHEYIIDNPARWEQDRFNDKSL
jgi:putative transposase